jgi:Cu(I)/Ag(I) efflux system membrane protein CusA/SilA
MPTLEEGSLLFMPVLLPSTSLTEVNRIMSWQDKVISAHPEVVSVAGKLGRAETATDPAPVEMIETTIALKPASEWRPGVTKAQIIAELSERLSQVPGYVPGFLQPIENRILMTSTGIRAQVGVKIFGDNLEALQAKAFEIERVVAGVPGATGVAPSRAQGKPYLEITPDREALRRYGLRVADVFSYVETGMGGAVATTTLKGRERWPVQVRLERADRDDLEKIGDLLIPTPSGPFVPLRQVATVKRVIGASEIQSENGRLRVFVQANVRDRDLGGFVDEIKAKVTQSVTLDPGMTIEYSGQYEHQLRARQTLAYVFPAVLMIIFVLLVMTFRSVSEAAHVILAVPFALTGGVILQSILGFNFSVAVWVGYIALFGTAIQTGVVMVVYLEEAVVSLRQQLGRELTREELIEAIKAGARLRLRPKVMTVATTVASLLPIFWSARTGVEVMQPIAAPVVGGMVSSLLHILLVTPVIFAWLHESKLRVTQPQATQ